MGLLSQFNYDFVKWEGELLAGCKIFEGDKIFIYFVLTDHDGVGDTFLVGVFKLLVELVGWIRIELGVDACRSQRLCDLQGLAL